MRKTLIAAAVALASIAFAQQASAPVAKLEILDVEATVPVSPSSYPSFPLGYDSEIDVPLAATDAAGNPVAGVEVTWTVQNTGKVRVHVIGKRDNGQNVRVRGIAEPGATFEVKSVTGADGRTAITLNANDVAQVRVNAKAGEVNARNLREAQHQVDWMK